MEEVRRLRIQQRLKVRAFSGSTVLQPSTPLAQRLACEPPGAAGAQGGEKSREEEVAQEQYQAVVPLLPARTDASMKEYWRFYLTSVCMIILFGGLLAPILEVKMGLGGASLAQLQDRDWSVWPRAHSQLLR